MLRRTAFALLFLLSLSTAVRAADGVLQDNDFVAICGDSITEQKLYSVFIEDYLLMCRPKANLRAAQFGWGGETAPMFLSRMENEVLRFKPTVATTCYGMNDGGYAPLTEDRAKRYRDAQTAIVERFKKAGVRVVLGSPGAVDSNFFRKDPKQAEMYNKTLEQLTAIDREIASQQQVAFADLHNLMIEIMAKAKAKYGSSLAVCGNDGVHPDKNGHLIMAYAFLKALGCDGDIGTITLNLAGESSATNGHRVISSENNEFVIESTRYPFCFYGKPTTQSSTTNVLEFLPFNQDLNRLMLIVNGAGNNDAKIRVTWGDHSKEFSAGELSKGINLAAEFTQNPFSKPFADVEQKIRQQQEFETPLVKQLLHSITTQSSETERAKLEQTVKDPLAKDARLLESAAGAVTPIRHTIKLELVK